MTTITFPSESHRPRPGEDLARGVKLDEKKLTELGELVYSRGGKGLLKLIADARAGKRLEF